ncbi:MAG: hypothetical protein QG636_567 [Patescibacteria group bacterium]|nr:hypothetical protein [Patescibacteria group bacterium]
MEKIPSSASPEKAPTSKWEATSPTPQELRSKIEKNLTSGRGPFLWTDLELMEPAQKEAWDALYARAEELAEDVKILCKLEPLPEGPTDESIYVDGKFLVEEMGDKIESNFRVTLEEDKDTDGLRFERGIDTLNDADLPFPSHLNLADMKGDLTPEGWDDNDAKNILALEAYIDALVKLIQTSVHEVYEYASATHQTQQGTEGDISKE